MRVTVEAENVAEEKTLEKEPGKYVPLVYDNVQEFMMFGLRISDVKTLAIHHFKWWSGNFTYLLGTGKRVIESLQQEEIDGHKH